MTETAKILLAAAAGAAGTLAVMLVVAVCKHLWGRHMDRLCLRGELSSCADFFVMNAVGCPCLELTVACSGRRRAKLEGAKLRLEGTDLMRKFQDGFQNSLGYTPPASISDRRETLKFPMVRLVRPSVQEDIVLLERDDACKFYFPLKVPGLELFAKAPSQDVSIAVVLLDGTEHEIMRGLEIQTAVRGLIEAYGSNQYPLKITIPIEVSVRSTTPADDSMVGKTNPKPVRFDG